jgi:hypothetical protein
MDLDVLKVRGILERGVVPVQVPHPPVDLRVFVPDLADVAL